MEQAKQRGRETTRTKGGKDTSVKLHGRCAVCKSVMRTNEMGKQWCTQTVLHRMLS